MMTQDKLRLLCDDLKLRRLLFRDRLWDALMP